MPESNSIVYKDSKIFYEMHGSGKPVILLHGFAETGMVWFGQVEYLKNHFKIIVPDLPCCGKSSELNAQACEAKIEDYADCIYAVLQEENINDCVIIGHSMGGYITLCIAEKYPEMLSAFGFVHSTAFADSEEKKQNRLRGIEMIENYGGYAFLKNTTPNLFARKFKNEHPDIINKLIEEGKQFSKKSLQQCYYAMMNRGDKTHVLKNTRVPVLFIAGKEDNAVPLNDALKQSYFAEISYIHILNHAAHMGMWEAADTVNEYLEEFVNETA